MFNKSTQHLLAILGLSLVLAVSITASRDFRPCDLVFRCSNEGPIVWATDNNTCTVWTNACQLANENCNRENRCEKPLQVVTQEECQKLCPDACPLFIRPVCAEYNGQNRTFSNGCELGVNNCKTGEIYTFIKDGEC